ncbi:MAG: hypothetical protein MK291_11445 [Planctomycetes bacterium]|nr:hypothetical protein [Planctomycetota bacterium]
MTHKELDLGMSLFLELIQGDPSLDATVQEARSEYFQGGGGFSGDPRSAPAAEVRFLEWLLFERDHDGDLLVERLLPTWRECAAPELLPFESTFLGTLASIFEVGDDAGGGLFWLRDVPGLGEFAVEVRVADGQPQQGDLIVGRLFPTGDSTHVLSPGAGCFRDEHLIAAVYRDLEQARQDRTHQALRIRQEDLEAMFWGGALQEGERSDPVSELRSFLEAGGLTSDEVDGLMDALSKRPVPSDVSGPFFISAIQDLLEHLAFETELDLVAAQSKFVACWLHLQGSPGPSSVDPEEPQAASASDPQAALKAFDEDRAAGLDAETAISRLTARLGLEGEAEGDSYEPEGAAPAGLVDGLLEEYRWELSSAGDRLGPARHAALDRMRDHHRHTELVEDLTPKSLLLFACTALVELPESEDEAVAEGAGAIADFMSWCVEHHGHLEDREVSEAFKTLQASVTRIHEINQHFDPTRIEGEWLQVERSGDGLGGVSSSGERHELGIPDQALGMIQIGDYVRATINGGSAVVRWCYPPELAAAQ